jgi:hypothetical protein
MARRRMIPPDIWSDEAFGLLSYRQRLLKIGLTTLSDDEGRFSANAALIKATVFPYDSELSLADVEGDLQAVVNSGAFQLYEFNGRRYGFDPEWKRDQNPQHKTPSRIPPPPGALQIVENSAPSLFHEDFTKVSREPHEDFVSKSSQGQSSVGQVSLGEVSVGQGQGRWTFDSSDKGNFYEIEIYTAYQELTCNRPKESDKQGLALLKETGFSSQASVLLMRVVKKRAHCAIRSLNYFARSISELAERVSQAVSRSSQMSVGACGDERSAMACAAVLRELVAWEQGIAQKAG